MNSKWIAAVAAAGALAAPATADAATLAVQGDRIVFVGDEGPSVLWVEPVENGRQTFEVDSNTVLGPGCTAEAEPAPGTTAKASCALDGVTAFQVDAGPGDDQIWFWSTNALGIPTFVDMGPGNDHWDLGSAVTDTVTAGDGNDVILNGRGDDVLRGGAGDDVVYGGSFDEGKDQLYGEDGNDNLDGLAGDDLIDGGPGDDNLQPGGGFDTLRGGAGNDRLSAGEGDDTMAGDEGADDLTGGNGNDVMSGGEGDDKVLGEVGNDTVGGVRQGDAAVCAEPGNDTVDGGDGNDLVCGGDGVDTISGGEGFDKIGALDRTVDVAIACGGGEDLLASDALDPVALDCERQAQADEVALKKSGLVSLPVSCPAACSGTVTLALSPRAVKPAAGAYPALIPNPSRKALVRVKFKLRGGGAKLRLRLPAKVVKQLRRSRRTPVEMRAQVTGGGTRATVRRMFVVARK
jgi:Ca2+-binding RTX toxin-like protein